MSAAADWVERHVKTTLTADHRRCVTVAAAIARGAAYNLATNWKRVEFHPWGGVTMTIRTPLSTFDFDNLTALVLAAHQHAVRVELSACGPRHMRLRLHPREHDEDATIDERHPSLHDLADRALTLIAEGNR